MHEFSVYEYLSRIENAVLEIEENKKPIDAVIVLWWGLDGLRLNEDGTTEWISRKKVDPVNQDVFYQPCQTRVSFPGDMCQSTQATIEQIAGLKMQLDMANFNMALQNQIQGFNSALQSCVVQSPEYYARLTDCCCNRLI